MNKYFMSQIIYDRFKLYPDDKQITKTMDSLRKGVRDEKLSQQGLNRVLKKNVDFFNNIKSY